MCRPHPIFALIPCLLFGCSAGEGPENPPGNNGTGGILLRPDVGDPEGDCDNVLPVLYRDFKADHPDFEMSFAGDVVRRGLVAPELGGDRKPVFVSSTGCPWKQDSPLECDNWQVTNPEITSAETFAQWYHDVEGVNHAYQKELVLAETSPGSGNHAFESRAFFPLTVDEGWKESHDANGTQQNYHFTTEIHLQFAYVPGQRFSFFGDDDLWIFINGKLALDLGGMHMEAAGTIDFDAQAAELGISSYNSYSMDIFHAERHTRDSHFRIETNISCFVPVEIY